MNDGSHSHVEDIEACARDGRRPRDHGPYRVQIGDALFRFNPVLTDIAVHTGRTLLDVAGLHPVQEHVLFAVLIDGLLEEIRLEEKVDLREGIEKFLAFRNDRFFRLLINGSEYQWGGTFISGASLLKLAKADAATHAVWIQLNDGSERQLGRAELIDLGEPGTESFVTKPLAA